MGEFIIWCLLTFLFSGLFFDYLPDSDRLAFIFGTFGFLSFIVCGYHLFELVVLGLNFKPAICILLWMGILVLIGLFILFSTGILSGLGRQLSFEALGRYSNYRIALRKGRQVMDRLFNE